jgi:hypothetical protein
VINYIRVKPVHHNCWSRFFDAQSCFGSGNFAGNKGFTIYISCAIPIYRCIWTASCLILLLSD